MKSSRYLHLSFSSNSVCKGHPFTHSSRLTQWRPLPSRFRAYTCSFSFSTFLFVRVFPSCMWNFPRMRLHKMQCGMFLECGLTKCMPCGMFLPMCPHKMHAMWNVSFKLLLSVLFCILSCINWPLHPALHRFLKFSSYFGSRFLPDLRVFQHHHRVHDSGSSAVVLRI